MSKTFKFEPASWSGNRDLRACSAAARGFWVDLLIICHANSGYLHLNGKPIDDNQLARMVGEPVKSVRIWLAELGEAGIFSVDDRGLYSSRMRRAAAPMSTRKKPPKTVQEVKEIVIEIPATLAFPEDDPDVPTVVAPSSPKKPALVKGAKSLPWFKTPAGWARMASAQGVSLMPDEDFEDFKGRVAKRIPPGPHLDELDEYHKKEILAKINQYAAKEGEQPKTR